MALEDSIGPKQKAWCLSCGAFSVMVVAFVLLTNLAVDRKRIYYMEFQREWWGEAMTGCWIGERFCVPEQRGFVDTNDFTIWQEGNFLDMTESECMGRANRYWSTCEHPTEGSVIAAFRPNGQTVMMPQDAGVELMLQ